MRWARAGAQRHHQLTPPPSNPRLCPSPIWGGISKPPAGAIIRVPAADIEGTVTKAVAEQFQNRTRSMDSSDQDIVAAQVSHVEVRKDQLAIWLKTLEANEAQTDAARPFDRESAPSFLIPWCKPPSKKSREILLPRGCCRSTN